VLEAAAQILERGGVAAFNTNAVAERAGVSIGSLYQYFPGKDALLIALMRREKERFRDDAAAAVAATTGLDALHHLIGATVRQQMDRPELARLLDVEETRPGARQEVDRIGGFREIVRSILVRPDMPPQPDPDAAVDDLMSLMQVLVDAAGARGEPDAATLERRVEAVVMAYLRAAGDDVHASNVSPDAASRALSS
jgi:AcrR family transcriptional regulator